jgi:hypothetical protein
MTITTVVAGRRWRRRWLTVVAQTQQMTAAKDAQHEQHD